MQLFFDIDKPSKDLLKKLEALYLYSKYVEKKLLFQKIFIQI